jgi:hypothetical protein
MLIKRRIPHVPKRQFVIAAICGAFLTATCFGQDRTPQDTAANTTLKAFLKDYLKSGSAEFDKTTRYSAAFADLSGDEAPEVVVYVSGRAWRGSGGCSMLILKVEGASFSVIARTTITRPPIRMLQTVTNGWHDVCVWVQGGGVQTGYAAVLSYNSKTYASNPTVPLARPSTTDPGGEILIPTSAEGILLYP